MLFWPGLLATYANTGDAISAAQERQRHLTKIYDGKTCDQAKLAASAAASNAIAAAAAAAPSPVPVTSAAVDTYKVNSMSGARVFTGPMAEGEALHTFANDTVLSVVETTKDTRWHKVLIPDGRTGFVAAAVVSVSKASGGAAGAK